MSAEIDIEEQVVVISCDARMGCDKKLFITPAKEIRSARHESRRHGWMPFFTGNTDLCPVHSKGLVY